MSAPLRVLTFGIGSGLVWAIIAGVLDQLFVSTGEVVTVLASGVLSGIVVSFLLLVPLAKSGRWVSLVFGLLSLPLGAFAFAVLASAVQWAARESTGFTGRFIASGFSPVDSGLELALLSIISIFAFLLFPLAVLTTFLLRGVILWKGRSAQTRNKNKCPHY
jgi:hypothetical protein